jgi:tetratricopeptide (TPR) repeat protein
MSKSRAISRPFEQTGQQRAELDALRRMLDISEGAFSLSVAICNSPALRDHIIGHVTSEIEQIKVIRIPEETRDVFDFVRTRVSNGRPGAVFVVDIDKAFAGDKTNRVLQGLNVSREQWRSTCECPVVFWLPEYVVSLLMTHARDLWSWISHHFEFVSEQATASANLQETFGGDFLLAGNLDVHEKHFRVAELEQRLADIGEESKGHAAEHISVWLNELAYLYEFVGELGKAEHALRRALEVNQKLGRLKDMAHQYRYLGLIHLTRGDFDRAEKMHRKALEICEEHGHIEDMAKAFNNLGLVYQKRGNINKAEEMHKKALEIDQKLGELEGMAIQYSNLGAIYLTRGDLDEAEKMHRKALEIEEALGRSEGVASDYGNLGVIYRMRGDLDEGEKMLRKSLEISQKLGWLEGIASNCSNLGLIYQARGDLAQARKHWEEALALFQKIGARVEVQAVQRLLDGLPKDGQ